MSDPMTRFVQAYDTWAHSPEHCAGPLFDAMVTAREEIADDVSDLVWVERRELAEHEAAVAERDAMAAQVAVLESDADRVRLTTERDARGTCNGSCDIALARRQVGPDGIVPGNARECAEAWEAEAARLRRELLTERDAMAAQNVVLRAALEAALAVLHDEVSYGVRCGVAFEPDPEAPGMGVTRIPAQETQLAEYIRSALALTPSAAVKRVAALEAAEGPFRSAVRWLDHYVETASQADPLTMAARESLGEAEKALAAVEAAEEGR